jgi:FkbM family methyltransferase
MTLVEALKTSAKLLMLDEKSIAVLRWKMSRGDQTLRLDYRLAPDSVVFDVGGYRGDWAAAIVGRYGSHIHIFEPLKEYCDEIARRLGGKPNVVINEFGLSGKNERCLISVDEAGSSVVKLDGKVREIQLVDIYQYVTDRQVRRIDLVKINIEGGEYDLLARMHEKDLLRICGDIQVQFHDFVPDARERRRGLREILGRTHKLTYDYPFIWENWHLSP